MGTVLEGRYRLTGRLGEGGVGWVYRAEHLKLGTEVAIKMLQAPYAQHEMLRPRFEREAKALASLRHPHIVTLTDYSIAEDGHPYLVMERLEGRTLGERIAEGPMDEARARRILGQVLDALIYAHEKGFAHRDLKPSNIFLVELPTDPDHVKILDFGFVKLLGGDPGKRPALTRSGIAFGTPSYMCPEQATGGRTDPRADLYSAGVVFFEMLAGHKPYTGEIPEVIRQHLTEPVPSLDVGGAPRAATPALRRFLERAMAKEPDERFQTARAMRAALDALPEPAVEAREGRDARRDRGPVAAEATRPATPAAVAVSSAAQEPRRRAPVLPILAAVVALGGVGALAWTWLAADAGTEVARSGTEGAGGAGPGAEAAGEVGDAVGGGEGSGQAGDPVDEGPGDVATAGEGSDDGGGGAGEGSAEVGDPSEVAEGADAVGDGAGGAPAEAGDEVEEAPGGGGEGDERAAPADLDFTGGAGSPDDPWQTREPVPLLEAARRRLRTGDPLPRGDDRRLRRYVRSHRDDPRPHLLLARHFMARGHDLSAVQRYSLAHRVDERARHDPRMLEDLIALARRRVVSDDATEVLGRVYGRDAVPALDRALGDPSLGAAERHRLQRVRSSLLER